MGRQNKVDLPYFELDCHMDDKIKLIQAEFGLKGFAVVVKLYQRIYGGEFGYYCEWDEERSLLFALENGLNGDGKNLIDNIVSACIKRNIFSDELYKKYGVLTSAGVQKQYLKATAKREAVELKKEYLLISVPENRSNVVINAISGGRNAISDTRNTQSKSKSKSKSKSYKDRVCVQRIEDFLSAYPKDFNRYLTETAYIDLLMTGKVTEDELVQCSINYAETMKIKKTSEDYIKNAENFLKEMVFEKYLPCNYKKPAPAKSKNNFNDFEQNDYDFDALEKELMQN